MEHNRDILEMLEIIVSNNTPEQIQEADQAIPEKDEIQEQSFALLKQFVEQRK
ncbi:hypothetical protein HVZ88_25445 (plasmid) [Escherichia coli]|mgnify:FL=1|nr:hypothetical protein HVZ88_25445 [Escherichia coli]